MYKMIIIIIIMQAPGGGPHKNPVPAIPEGFPGETFS